MEIERNKKLRKFMSDNRFMQKHLAEALGVTDAAISHILSAELTEAQQGMYIESLREHFKC